MFFTGRDSDKLFLWKLKPELVEALEIINFTGDIQYPDELSHNDSRIFIEGIKRTIIVNSYERNSKARSKCIKHYKAICQVCEFNFQEKYGEIGAGYIHVHHLTPIHKVGSIYEVNPIKDLIPVCPNCHAMLHMENPPIKPERLKEIIKNNLA